MASEPQPRLQDVLDDHAAGMYSWGQDGCSYPCEWQGTTDEHPAHQAAMWRDACTIRTVAELDALPAEAIVKTEGGTIACRFYDRVHGVVFGDDRPFKWPDDMASELPALLLWHPSWSAQ